MIIALTYLGAVIVLCVSIFRTKMELEVKAVLIISFVASAVMVFNSLESYKGKPLILEKMPPDVIIYGQALDHDNKLVFLLMAPTEVRMPPKMYLVPLTQELREALAKGMKGSKGKPFRMQSKGDGEKGGNGKKGEKGKKGDSISHESQTHDIMTLPPPKLPKKELQ